MSGLYVTPGLIDLHVHVYHTPNVKDAWAGDNSVQPDAFSFRTGTTTMVDAGSSGWRNFEDFRFAVVDRVKTRVLALINIAGFGMMTDFVEQGDFDAAAVAALAKKHKDVVVGVKSAHYQKPDWESVGSGYRRRQGRRHPDHGGLRLLSTGTTVLATGHGAAASG